MDDICVSVVVPLYNEENNLDRCVSSIRNQTLKNIEIILVDDGSKDKSADVCRELEKKDSRIRYVYKENGGLASARNFGMKYVNTPFVSFIDCDDWIEPAFLEKLYNAITDKSKPADWAICGYCRDYGETNRPLVSSALRTEDRDTLLINILDTRSYSNAAWNKMYRMSVIRENNLTFNSKYSIGEDFGFSIDYALVCNGCNYVPEVLYHYIMNPISMTHKMSTDPVYNPKWLREWDVVKDTHELCRDCGEDVQRAYKERKFSIALRHLNLMKKCSYKPDNYTKEMFDEVKHSKTLYFHNKFIKIPRQRKLDGFKAYMYYIGKL